MILPRQVRSGRTPNSCCAPPGAARKPEITSSKTSSVPCAIADGRAGPARKPSRGGTRPMLPAIGSTMIAAICSRCRVEHALDRLEVVVARDQRVGRGRRRHAGAGRHAQRHRARSGLDQERVGVPVVAALELDDLVAPGRRARDAHRAHRRLGPRADEPHALHRRHQHRDALRQPCLELGRRAEAGAARRGRRPSAFSSPFGAWPWISGPQDIT